MSRMRVLIACEFSGIVRDAFVRMGHDAMSCDLISTEQPGRHYQGRVEDIIGDGWDMMIAHPPCTYLCSSGLHWNGRTSGRARKTWEAIRFVELLWSADIPRIAIENPKGCLSTFSELMKPTQIIQPYEFGEDASKETCLWLKGLPRLNITKRVPGRLVEWPVGSGKMVERWANQTDSNQNKLGPSDTRAKDRAKTYEGIASAMAEQWG